MVRTFFAPPPPPPMPQPIDLDTGPPGGIHLAEPAGVVCRFRSCQGDIGISSFGKAYSAVVYFRRCSRVDEFGYTHRGGVWFGTESRQDQRGVDLSRSFTDLVTDDYGQLVSSDTGVAP